MILILNIDINKKIKINTYSNKIIINNENDLRIILKIIRKNFKRKKINFIFSLIVY